MKFFTKRLRWFVLGAAIAWLFDPEQGAARRERLTDRARELMSKLGFEGDRSTPAQSGWAPAPEPVVPAEPGLSATRAS